MTTLLALKFKKLSFIPISNIF